MSTYGKPTDFNFGHNIHDFDPDRQQKSGKRMEIQDFPAWYERSPDGRPSIDALVSEIKDRIAAITDFVRQEGTLINYEQSAPQQSRGGSRQQQAKSTTFPTLKKENMTFDKTLCRILAARQKNGTYGPQVAVKVAYRGQTWMWYLKTSNDGRTKFLLDSFSPNEDAWVGKEFLMWLETDEFDNSTREQMELPVAGGTKRK